MNSLPISVIMPCYNNEGYVGKAITSILDQTFSDFELIIINDGSTDNSRHVSESYTDKRIKHIYTPVNAGNYIARNLGIKAAQGKYLAMMDADDISLPHRLEKQFHFLESQPLVGLIGALSEIIDEYGEKRGAISRLIDHQSLKVNLLRANQFTQSTVMVRAKWVRKYQLYYNENLKYTGDYDFVVRAANLFETRNLHQVMVQYRQHKKQISQQKSEEQLMLADKIRLDQLYNLGLQPNEAEKEIHLAVMRGLPIGKAQLKGLIAWFNKIMEANDIKQSYDSKLLFHFLESLTKNSIKIAQ